LQEITQACATVVIDKELPKNTACYQTDIIPVYSSRKFLYIQAPFIVIIIAVCKTFVAITYTNVSNYSCSITSPLFWIKQTYKSNL
jgi:hypothetical protein